MERGAENTANDVTSFLKGMTGTSDDFHKRSLENDGIWRSFHKKGSPQSPLIHSHTDSLSALSSNTRETTRTEARERPLTGLVSHLRLQYSD